MGCVCVCGMRWCSQYAQECSAIVARYQTEDTERAQAKKDELQAQVRCLYDLVKKRSEDLNDVRRCCNSSCCAEGRECRCSARKHVCDRMCI